MKRWFLFIIIVAPILYLLSFGLTRDAKELPSMMIGKKAPDFSLQTRDGKIISLASLTGKPIVINFWATWCTPCLIEQAVFQEASKIYAKQGVEFLGIVYQDSKEAVDQFVKQYGEPFQIALDPESRMAIDYGIGGIPETFLIDKEGIIRHKFLGMLTLDRIKTNLEPLIQK